MSLLNPPLERMFFMTFTVDLKEFAKKTNKEVIAVIKEVSIDLFSEIINETPIGDPSLWKSEPPSDYVPGSLQSNWQCSIETPESGRLTAITSGQATISAMESVVMSARSGQTIYLANNLPYAERIEYLGWSHMQKPEGMVRVSIAKFQNKLSSAVAKVAA